MTFSFGDLLTDVKESRYFQVWTILWIAVMIVFWIGFAAITNYAALYTNPDDASTYRISDADMSDMGIEFPQIQISTLAPAATINEVACSGPLNQPIGVVPGQTQDGQPAQNVHSNAAISKPTTIEMACVVMLNPVPNGTSKKLRMSFADGGNFPGETIYISTDAYATVYLNKVVYMSDPTISKPWSFAKYNPWYIEHKLSGNYTGTIQLWISMSDFDVPSYIQYQSYTGWEAYSDIGGQLMFAYFIHLVLMFIVGIFLTNDSRVLGGARQSYATV